MNALPFLPFTQPSIDEQPIVEIGDGLRSDWITTGPTCTELEAALSARFGGRPVRLVNSGTASLELGLRLCGIGPGDEVITTPLSWVATANVVLAVGATPVFVDVDAATRNIDLSLVEAAITPRTKALMPVDLAGLPVDRDRLYDIAHRHKLRVVEDAAQSFGSQWRGHAIGNFGDLTSFSFHPHMNFTTSEGGCLVLNNLDEVQRFEELRLHGVTQLPDSSRDVEAWDNKTDLTEVAAAIGLGHLRTVDAAMAHRHTLAAHYFKRWNAALGCELPPVDAERHGNWHMFQPLLPRHLSQRRPEFIACMKSQGIGVGVHYPAMHLFTMFHAMGYKPGDFPVSEDIGSRIVTLPLFPGMTSSDVDRVCNAAASTISALR